jgi:hypothetical protein
VLGRDSLELRPQPLVELDHVHGRHPRRQLRGQRPLTAPDLKHYVVAADLRLADDRLEQVRISEKVLS